MDDDLETAVYFFNVTKKHEMKLEIDKKTNLEGWTPLHFATMEGRMRFVQFLIENGADLDIKDLQGQTARDVAGDCIYKEEIYSILDKYKKKRTALI